MSLHDMARMWRNCLINQGVSKTVGILAPLSNLIGDFMVSQQWV